MKNIKTGRNIEKHKKCQTNEKTSTISKTSKKSKTQKFWNYTSGKGGRGNPDSLSDLPIARSHWKQCNAYQKPLLLLPMRCNNFSTIVFLGLLISLQSIQPFSENVHTAKKIRDQFCSILCVPGHGKPSFTQTPNSVGRSVKPQWLDCRTVLVLGSMHCLLLLDISLSQNLTHGVHDDHSLSCGPNSE